MNSDSVCIPEARPDLLSELREGGADVTACYQCGRCSAGCPAAEYFDLKPMQVVRMCCYGQEEELLTSHTIWLCAACETCTTRCPNEIDIARVMDVLRSRALAAGHTGCEPKVVAFHKSFLDSVRNHGRLYEMGMVAGYKLRSRDLFSDLGMGFEMLKRNKFKFLPARIKGTREMRAIFRDKDRK